MDDILSFVEFLLDKGRDYDILLFIGELGEESHPFETFPIFVEFPNNHIFDRSSESCTVDDPKSGCLSRSYRGSAFGEIEKGDFSEP